MNKDGTIDVQDDDIMEASQSVDGISHSLTVAAQVVPHANGTGDNKRKGAEDGSEPASKKSRSLLLSITRNISRMNESLEWTNFKSRSSFSPTELMVMTSSSVRRSAPHQRMT